MNFVCIIPSRYASTRLPGKPLCDIAGKPMVQRVYEQASKASKLTAPSTIPRSMIRSFLLAAGLS